MDDLNLLLRYATRALFWVAPLEFLLGRALSRAGKQMPAGDVGAAIFSVISLVGNFLVMPALLLVILVLILTAVAGLRGGAAVMLPGSGGQVRLGALLLFLFVAASVGLLVPNAPAPILFAYNVFSAVIICGLAGWFVLRGAAPPGARVVVGLFGLAYAGYYGFALSAVLAQTDGLPIGDWGVWANAAGEAIGMAAGICLVWTAGLIAPPAGAPRPRRLWIGLAATGALLLLIAPLFEQWLQGVATQFSVGFTLFLPVPVTALALGGWIYAALAFNSRQARAVSGLPWAAEFGGALLLLPAAGYQLQLNYQHLLLVVVFLLCTGVLRPLSSAVGAPARAAVRAEAEPRATG